MKDCIDYFIHTIETPFGGKTYFVTEGYQTLINTCPITNKDHKEVRFSGSIEYLERWCKKQGLLYRKINIMRDFISLKETYKKIEVDE